VVPSTTVIINNTPVIYPVNDPINGYGYVSTPPLATVVETLPNGRTRMTTSEIDAGCTFPGYAAFDQTGQTVLSPFAIYSGCTPYLYRRYVVFSTPSVCADRYVELTSINPWNAYDAAGSVTASSLSLRTALDDVAAYWQEGRIAGLRRRTAPDVSVAVFRGDRFAYSLHRTDFLALASDALQDVHTVSFQFTDVRRRSDGLISATAEHRYYPRGGSSRAVQTARIGYTFVYLSGDWYVTAFTLAS